MGILNTITKALGLDNTKKTPKEPTRIPKTVQDSIPYLGAYENGIIQVSARGYSRMYALSDINFSIESMDEQRAIFGKYSEFIGSFGPEVQMQVVVHNKSISSSEFEQNVLIGMKNDSLNEYREEMNNMLIDKMAVARNNIIHNKYLVVYIEADDIEAAKNTFSRLDSSISSGLKKLIGTDVAPCSIRERLSNLYDIYHVDSDIPFYQKLKMRDGRISETFNLKELKKRGLTTKDEAALGSIYELSPTQRSVIDRCTKNVYMEYVEGLRARGLNYDADTVPTLRDLYDELKQQPQPEAQNLALALERFAVGTQDTFAHKTNVNIINRFTVYNIKDIGSGLKNMGLQICLDNVWNRMIENHKKGKYTWLFCDEFHLLTQTETSAKYTNNHCRMYIALTGWSSERAGSRRRTVCDSCAGGRKRKPGISRPSK